MASITEVKKVRAATKTLFEFNLIGLKRVEMIWRNLGKGRPAWMKKYGCKPRRSYRPRCSGGASPGGSGSRPKAPDPRGNRAPPEIRFRIMSSNNFKLALQGDLSQLERVGWRVLVVLCLGLDNGLLGL